MANYFEVLCAVIALIIGAYYYLLWTYNFWKRRGVLGPTPKFFSGNTKELLLGKISLPRFLERLYYEYKNEPVIGIYFGMKPVAILRDPELVRDVLITNFSKFSDRNIGVYEKTEPMSTNLVNLEVERWRPLRGKLATAFTQSKIKETFSLILECSKRFETRLEKIATQGGPMNWTTLTGDFVVDATSSYSFGIDAGALENGHSQMRKKKTELFESNWENTIRFQMREYMPVLYRFVGYVIAEKRFAPFFTKLFKDVSSEREKKHIQRPDLIDVLMKIKQHPEQMPNTEVTDTFLAAQMTLFFGASVESSSNTLCGALLQLAIHQDVQDKLRQEIREYCGESTGDITFEAIKNMSYLDMVLKETLRMYPALMKLQRRTIAEHTFKGTNVTIPVGTEVWVPQFSLQRDADVYSNPDVFDPERFNPEAIAKRHPMHYIPFGDGPRNCIGLRFAIYQTKLGLVTIIRKYKVDVCDKTFLANEFSAHTVFLTIAEPIYLNVTKVED